MGVDCPAREKPCGYTGRSPIRKKQQRAPQRDEIHSIFFRFVFSEGFISSKCTSFSPPSIHLKSSRKSQTWRGTLERRRRRFQTKATPKTGEKKFPRENIGPFSRSLIFIIFKFDLFVLVTAVNIRMKRSDQHPINRQSIFRKRNSTQNKWIKEEKTVQQKFGLNDVTRDPERTAFGRKWRNTKK